MALPAQRTGEHVHENENIILWPESWGVQATRYPSSLKSSAMTTVGVPNTQRVFFGTNSTLRFNTKNQANGRQVGPLQSVLAVMSLLSLPSLRCQLGLQCWRLHPLRVFFFPGAAICGASQPWHGEDDPPPPNFNEVGHRLWWRGRTLQSIMA